MNKGTVASFRFLESYYLLFSFAAGRKSPSLGHIH